VNPKNSGMDEQEQKGVKTPNIAASKFPINFDLPCMKFLTVSVSIYVCINDMI
jgi:hypothetical protein